MASSSSGVGGCGTRALSAVSRRLRCGWQKQTSTTSALSLWPLLTFLSFHLWLRAPEHNQQCKACTSPTLFPALAGLRHLCQPTQGGKTSPGPYPSWGRGTSSCSWTWCWRRSTLSSTSSWTSLRSRTGPVCLPLIPSLRAVPVLFSLGAAIAAGWSTCWSLPTLQSWTPL